MVLTEEAAPTGELAVRPDGLVDGPSEIEGVRARVWLASERLIVLHELPRQSARSIGLMFDYMEELARPWPRFAHVVDLSDAGRPDAEVRAELRRRVERIRGRLIWVGIAVGENIIMRAMARVVAHAIGLGPVSMHTTRDEAISKVRDVLADRQSSY